MKNGFARIRCEDCGHEYLLVFSSKRRHFCPSCHQKQVVEFGEWLCREVVKAVPHRHLVLSGIQARPCYSTEPERLTLITVFLQQTGPLQRCADNRDLQKKIRKEVGQLCREFPIQPVQAVIGFVLKTCCRKLKVSRVSPGVSQAVVYGSCQFDRLKT